MFKLWSVMLRWKVIIFLSVFMMQSAQLFSQYIFSHSYESMPGLSTNIFYAVEHDSEGGMWFITQVGVVRYDGVEWQQLPDSLGLPIQENSSLVALEDGGVALIGVNNMEEGVLAIYKNNTWNIKRFPNKSRIFKTIVWEYKGRVNAAFTIKDSIFYFAENANIWKAKPLKTSNYNYSNIRNLRANNDKLYVIDSKGIYFTTAFSDFKELNIATTNLPSSDIYDLGWSTDSDSTFVLGSNYLGLVYKDSTQLLILNKSLNQVARGIFSSIKYTYPFVYYTLSSHLYLYDLSTKESLKINGHEFGTLTKWHDIDVDRQGILWMVNTRGVSKLPSLAFSNYTNKYFLDDEVSTILPLSNGNAFLGHNIGFTLVNDSRKIIWSYTFKPELGFTRIMDAYESNDGNIYATSSVFGLIKINPKTKSIKYFKDIEEANCVTIKGDTVYVGTAKSLIKLVNDKVVSVLETNYIRRLAFDLEGNLLMMQQKGVFDVKHLLAQNSRKNIGSKYNVYFAGEYKGRLLLATLGGLYYYDNGTYEELIIDGAHFNQPVYTFAVDDHDDLWIGTSNGVYKVCDNEMLNHFDATNGLVSNEINRAALKFDQHGHLWIGCHKGLSVYDSHMDNTLKSLPNVVINSIGNGGEIYTPLKDIELDYASRDLDFSFSAYSFYSETSINFQYQLIGFDDGWQTIGNYGIRNVKYDNLPPGEYKFKLRARESQRGWSPVVETASISINAPFYFSFWFIAICVLGAISIVAFITTFINQKNLAKNLDEKLQEKMKEVLDSKVELSQQNEELKILNIQLDSFAYSVSHDLRAPIASSLGLINLFKLDKKNRDKYFELIEKSMIRMDKFITDVLEVSRNARTEVALESFNVIEQIGEIIENQKYREGARDIEFQIKTKNEMIRTDKRRLCVILTNLISNAITYNDNAKATKQVEISFLEEGDEQIIKVKDNGIGIEAEHLSSLFNIFYRATAFSNGSGLGLYIADQTTKKLNGRLLVNSEMGEWTEFKLVLPKVYFF